VVAFSAGGDGGKQHLRRDDLPPSQGDPIKYPKLPWTRLFAFAALLVFGAVTLAWWGFLAWLIWRVI
jgi:hypothetical protein